MTTPDHAAVLCQEWIVQDAPLPALGELQIVARAYLDQAATIERLMKDLSDQKSLTATAHESRDYWFNAAKRVDDAAQALQSRIDALEANQRTPGKIELCEIHLDHGCSDNAHYGGKPYDKCSVEACPLKPAKGEA